MRFKQIGFLWRAHAVRIANKFRKNTQKEKLNFIDNRFDYVI